MDINPKLAGLNPDLFSSWYLTFTPGNFQPALLVFNGEVCNGLKASTLPA